MGFESLGELARAHALVDEILRLEPNSVRHRQKHVEFAFKSGEKGKLIDAYLELADALLRQDLPEKARAVYQRITEHDPTNKRANAALAMFAPVAPGRAESRPKVDKQEGRVAPKDAKMKVRDDASGEGEFVDLAAMMLEEPQAERDTRMKVTDEEPSGETSRRCWRASSRESTRTSMRPTSSRTTISASRSRRWGCWTRPSRSSRKRCGRPRAS
ncbi:MAG: hypothetical protein DMD36_08565 [Gemmatimonadetes bacterium]|nr:MAG: hypothetical protein DMD36_08565 [Gemmatimonadota bacterium]